MTKLKKQEKYFMKKQVEDWILIQEFIEYAKEVRTILLQELKINNE